MAPQGFPDTRPSLVRELLAGDDDLQARGREGLAAAYWRPIHAYLCHRWRVDPDDARDLTQDFFVQAFARGLFTQYDPARSRLRSWVRVCVDSHVRNAWKADARLKRGGGASHVDIDAPDLQLPSSDGEADAFFEREWLRGVFDAALAALAAECASSGKAEPLAVFRAADVDVEGPRPTYAELASRFGIPVTQVTNYLHWCRRRLRGHVLACVRAQCRTEEEYQAEVQAVFGVTP
ncbi:MAG: sigma-70 family RNA polymerase sigma factor [Gemmatimonadetes bacterium]|nr:sigma-70 family RNA polymerase sigma factor [Gemmatimonadota bacterium]